MNAARVMTVVAFGEMLVGVVLAAFPREVVLLLVDVALDARGIYVARVLAVAMFALGLTWWRVRGDWSLHAPGFIVYNGGVGLLFGWAAIGASQPLLAWLVCLAHLAAAVAFLASLQRRNR